ncbi:hypothetical protein HYV57_00965 [Candidatus Peregrinibacteria bacterium]|nr:hypothetical protein [Candidatus Peregrinibacteria bacterium]
MKYLSRLSTALMIPILAATMFVASFPIASAQNDLIGPGDNPDLVSQRTGGIGSFRELALVMLNFFLSFLGFVAVMFVIYAGILYVTAGGEEDKVTSAKKILTYAGLGLILILLSFALVNTLLAAGVGVEPA